MKKLLLIMIAFAMCTITVSAQEADIAPISNQTVVNNGNSDALFDLISIVDVGAQTATNGLAASIYFNDEYLVARWDASLSTDFHRLDNNGVFIETFTIPGVAGTRSITTDGTNLYMGTAGSQIFIVDPTTMSATGSIAISSTATARMLTYDETLDGGNGGFWIGNFGNEIASIDMNGNELSLIPAVTHGTVVYGGAIDNVSPGGPFLWIHSQSGTAPNRDFIIQLDPATGTQTGVQYDFSADGNAAGATEVLAGGLSITNELDAHNGYALVGLCQCTPSNLVFAVELTEALGTEDNELSSKLTIYPNPANGSTVSIETGMQGEKQIAVFDVLGKKVIDTKISNNELDITALNAGVYMVQVSQNNSTATKKLVVK